MSASARDGILDAVITALQGITIAGGYNTNLGQKIYRHRTAPLNDSDTYGLFVSLGTDVRTGFDSTSVAHELTIKCRLVVKNSSSTEDTMDKAEEDVVKVIEANFLWGGLAFDTDSITSEPFFEQHDDLIMGMDITFTVNYRTTRRA